MQIENSTSSPTLAIGQTRVVVIWKVVEYVGLILFIVIAPRKMGPDLYGRFAALLALIGLFTVVTGLGMLPTFGRFVPEYVAKGEKPKIQAIFTQFFCVSAGVAVLLSIVFLFVFPRLIPGSLPLTVAVGAGAFLSVALATTCYQIFYGLNILGRWLSQQALTRILLLILIAILGGWHDFDRASLALLATHLGFLLLGLFWARAYFTVDRSAFQFSFLFSHLRFGLLFFFATLLLGIVWRGGEVVVLLFSGRTTEVAFFNVANAVALAFAALLGQLAFMITPSLTTLHISGKKGEVDTWLGYSLKYLTIAAFFFLIVVHAVGVWAVGITMGEQYLPVIPNLKVLAFGLIPISFINTGFSRAIVQKQPGRAVVVAAGVLVVFLLASAALVADLGSYGASWAMVLAMGSGSVLAYHQFSLAPVLAAARYWRVVLLGFLALGALGMPLIPSVPMAVGTCALYFLLLLGGRVITLSEIRQIGQVLIHQRTKQHRNQKGLAG